MLTGKDTMLKTPALVVTAVLLVAGAVVNGAATGRWNTVEPNQALTERLHALDLRFEDWQPTPIPTDMPTNERSTATSRRYTSAATGRSAATTIFSGVPGAVSTHTPDVCYPGSGYRTVRGPKKESLEMPGGGTAVFYAADFEKTTATRSDRVRVRWAWTTDGGWIAPDNPRWQFAMQLTSAPVLYKVYVVTPLSDDPDAPAEDDPPARAFAAAAFAQYAAAFAR
ncbi:MAG TPA: hypothetical protein VH092_31480 [Urbifossiella sp.]|nr:hypothetical protein [Urbifossiella sp.]